jgi:hypothetical protein
MPVRAARHVALRVLPLCLGSGLATLVWAADAPPAATPEKAVEAKATAPADPADLGRGLRYLRLGAPADVSAFAAALAAPALVLDLRSGVDADAGTLARLRELFAQRNAARPVLVLLGADTSEPLRTTIPHSAPGVLTLAPKESAFAADVPVAVAPAQDHAAVEALAAGRPPRELIEEKIDKQRYDEARLAHDHANGVRERDSAPDAKPAEPAAAPLQDLLLQRAVFIHRALLALDRIPEHT